MTRLILVDPSPDELDVLPGDDTVETLTVADLDARLADRAGQPVDALVVGSGVAAPVAVVQQVHRAAPLAGVVVCTAPETDAEVRRQLSYAPGVPASIRVFEGSGPELAEVVREVLDSAQRQRRHEALLAAVTAQARTPSTQALTHASLGALLDHAPFGVLLGDLDEGLVTWNRRGEDMLGLSSGGVGQRISGLFAEPEALERAFELARAGRLTESHASHTLDATGLPVEVTAVPTQLEDGGSAVLVLLQDMSARRLAERSRDRLAAQVGLLSEVSEALAGTLDGDAALRRLATQVVPTLGDWVSLQTYDARGNTRRVAVHHRDPALKELAERAQEQLPHLSSQETPSKRVARGEGLVMLSSITPDVLASLVPEEEVREVVNRLGVASAVAVPLPGRDRVLGSMTIVNGPDATPFTAQDVAVAREIGRRAGVALETISLYAQQRDLAEGLQRSLLSRPVEPDHGEIAVRYVAAAEEAQVGGDWYDAFMQADGATVLVIGDVIGHDTRAAAAMGQLRGLLRGIGYTTGTSPARMLDRLDEAIEGLAVSTTATAVVARVEQEPEELAQGITRLRWSNAGHPPPVLVPARGEVALLDAEPSDLLLGVVPGTPRHEQMLTLGYGDTVLLYTDGLVERRGQDLDEGLARLRGVVEDLRDLPLEELCDALVKRMDAEGGEDDVALVAIRLHDQDRPRPAEAGPNLLPRPHLPEP